ncbi:MAG: GNAT family N-acetyltransferase [Actinomycetia bacterium]|nr:GNAT family N-acetyltransferase [Actinomycetes bacterium]
MIREIKISDYQEMSKLFLQYGHPLPEEEIKENIIKVKNEGRDKVFVETDSDNKVIGFIHIAPHVLLYFKPLANIPGIVVDKKHRRKGIGRRLFEKAKEWALENNLDGIRVISGNEREAAHAFYKSIGFKFIKSQGNFRMMFDQES